MEKIKDMTHEEKVKMYMKLNKRELIEMLIEANRVLEIAVHPVWGYDNEVGGPDYTISPNELAEYTDLMNPHAIKFTESNGTN